MKPFLEHLREKFPTAESLAFERIFAGRRIFFDTKNHQLLTGFSEPLVLAALMLGNIYAKEAGAALKLSAEEKRIWDRRFISDPGPG
jgi:hypothetical protein